MARIRSVVGQDRAQCIADGAHGVSEPVGLLPVLPAFGILVVGVAASLIVMLLEVVR